MRTPSWRATAPTRPADPTNPDDPAYRWPADVDLAVSEAARTGMKVLVLAMGTPVWAQGPGLEGRHPDYWHFLTETEAVRRTVAGVVARIREDRGSPTP